MIILNAERSLKTCMNLWKLNGNFMHRFEEKNNRRFVSFIWKEKHFQKYCLLRLQALQIQFYLFAFSYILSFKYQNYVLISFIFFRKRYCKNIKISAALWMSHCLNIYRLISKAIAIQWILKQIVKTKIYFC